MSSSRSNAGTVQSGRLGGATAGHHGLLRLHRKARGCPAGSCEESQWLRCHREAMPLKPRPRLWSQGPANRYLTDVPLRLTVHRRAAEREAQIVAEEKALVAKLAQLQAAVAQCQQALARKGGELVQSERRGRMVHVAVLAGPQLRWPPPPPASRAAFEGHWLLLTQADRFAAFDRPGARWSSRARWRRSRCSCARRCGRCRATGSTRCPRAERAERAKRAERAERAEELWQSGRPPPATHDARRPRHPQPLGLVRWAFL